MKKLYKYISLVGSKLVGRRHPRDIDPPGMKELLNAFVSKSDSAITARPDFNIISEDLEAVSDGMEFATSDSSDDCLNTAVGLYGSENLVFLSTFGQFDENGNPLTSFEGSGTASIVLNSKGVTGVGTSWNSSVWPGCVIEFENNGTKYKIDAVNSDTGLTLTKAAVETLTTTSYVISRIHQPDHADYKFNVQPYTSGAIYSCPSITVPINEKKICGPFYAGITSSTTSENIATVGASTALEDMDGRSLGPRTIATSGGFGMRVVLDEDETKVMTTADVTDPTSWVEVAAYPTDFKISDGAESSDSICDIHRLYDGSNHVYVVGGTQVSTSKYAIAYTNDYGASWTVKANSGAETGYIGPISSAATTVGTTYVYIAGSSDGAGLFYTDNFFTTWTPCTGFTITPDKLIAAIRPGTI